MSKVLMAIVVLGIGAALGIVLMSFGGESARAAQTDAVTDWKQLGQKTYRDNCLLCHGPAGAGMGKQYPALTGIGTLTATPAGRDYLIDVQLYGADSDRHPIAMTPIAHLRDNELAAVLNHVATSFGNKIDENQLFTAADIVKRRGQKITAKEVGARRPAATQPAAE